MSTRLSRGRSTPAIRATRAPSYPCRCLCRGFVQMTRTRPWRRMILHRSHIFFTDGCTFISRTSPSLVAVHDPAARQVVRRQLHQHPVSREDPDVMHPHLPRDVSQNVVPVFELHPEHGVGERLGDRSLDLDGVLLRQALPGVPRRRTAPSAHGRAETRPRTEAERKYRGHCLASSTPDPAPAAIRANPQLEHRSSRTDGAPPAGTMGPRPSAISWANRSTSYPSNGLWHSVPRVEKCPTVLHRPEKFHRPGKGGMAVMH